MRRPLESYSSNVLAELIRAKAITVTGGELDSIEHHQFAEEIPSYGAIFIGSLATAREEELAALLQPCYARENWKWGEAGAPSTAHIPTVPEIAAFIRKLKGESTNTQWCASGGLLVACRDGLHALYAHRRLDPRL